MSQLPFTNEEIELVLTSLQNSAQEGKGTGIDWAGLSLLLTETAHTSHRNWGETEQHAETLKELVGEPGKASFDSMFHRVLADGGWDVAAKAAEDNPNDNPWVVLVTGTNGIRKSTSVYQDWFPSVLRSALVGPSSFSSSFQEPDFPTNLPTNLPTGKNSFFRQLDYLIATTSSEAFREIYNIDDLKAYSEKKAWIFTRFRTIAEQAGLLLIKEAKAKNMNIFLETSGRNADMFKLVDHLFPPAKSSPYRKMVCHFTINGTCFTWHDAPAHPSL